MYVCLEGVKGSGKSTILAGVLRWLDESGIAYATMNPTRVSSQDMPLEVMLNARPRLRRYDSFNRRLYAARYNAAVSRVDWSQPLVLGDRSLVTTYVTRWTHWGDPRECIARVERSHKPAPAPDHVIYLCANLAVVRERIVQRVERNYGKQDETVERLTDAMQAYDDIRLGRVDVPRLHGAQWHVVDTEQPVEVNVQLCTKIIAAAMHEKNYVQH